MIKVTDLEYFLFIAFTLQFGVKSLLSEGGGTGRGYTHRSLQLIFFVLVVLSVSERSSFKHVDNTHTNKNNNFELLWVYVSLCSLALVLSVGVPSAPTKKG